VKTLLTGFADGQADLRRNGGRAVDRTLGVNEEKRDAAYAGRDQYRLALLQSERARPCTQTCRREVHQQLAHTAPCHGAIFLVKLLELPELWRAPNSDGRVCNQSDSLIFPVRLDIFRARRLEHRGRAGCRCHVDTAEAAVDARAPAQHLLRLAHRGWRQAPSLLTSGWQEQPSTISSGCPAPSRRRRLSCGAACSEARAAFL
jgi:hypothetical protein